jgi:threonine dehydrogenase-like Zn-dependent dehydrogenase
MKAVIIHAAHDLRVEDRGSETPGPGQVEVAIEAGGICGSDLHYFNHGNLCGCRPPNRVDRIGTLPDSSALP